MNRHPSLRYLARCFVMVWRYHADHREKRHARAEFDGLSLAFASMQYFPQYLARHR